MVKSKKVLDREKRHKRVRVKIFGTKKRPRLSVFRSNKDIYIQLIDDTRGHTLCSYSSLKLKEKEGKNKVEIAYLVGNEIGKIAKRKRIKEIVFDRGGYKFHGRVKALADSAREAGLSF
ncbi:MAG: 50S ribosomal protein L18 [Actinomycetota bacterium]